jgi:hypothetical protein
MVVRVVTTKLARILWTTGLVALLVVGCGGGYEPWPKTAGDTTCAEWIDEMSIDQRRGLGQAILTLLWDRDGAARTPPDDVVQRFADAVGGVCASYRDEDVSTVAGGLYALSDDVKP